MNPDFKPLTGALFWEKIGRARKVPPEERMSAGPRLFDCDCSITMNALREHMPDATEAQLPGKMRERIAIKHRLDESTR